MTDLNLRTETYHLWRNKANASGFGSADLIVAEENPEWEFDESGERVKTYTLSWWIDGLETIDIEYFDTEAQAIARMAELSDLDNWIDAADEEN